MGSCTNKSKDEVNSIKKVPQESTPAETVKTSNKPKYTIEITPEERVRRKSRKKLTVTVSNNDQIEELRDEFSEMAIVRQPSIGKNEQGSLIIVKKTVMYGGVISDNTQNDFEDKLVSVEGDDKNNSLSQNGIWVSCKKGLKPDSPNQDDFVVVIDPNCKLLGVFDGHGMHGHEISNFIHKAFPKHFFKGSNRLEALMSSFSKVQNDLVNYCNSSQAEFDCALSGSTATLLYLEDDPSELKTEKNEKKGKKSRKSSKKIIVAHVGDSRAVLGRRVGGKITAVDLTRDHKPNLPDEMSRIFQAGGEVRKMEEDMPHRVFFKGKHYPGIAMSRTVGDLLAQTIGVVCSPEVNSFDLLENDEFLIACSDGVWEFISSQEAVEEIEKYKKNPAKAAEGLATLAWNRWISNEEDVVDDITVVLAYLKPFSSV
jgi:serine/threonine protein phosphatase PrpC